MYDPTQQRQLLDLARDAVRAALRRERLGRPDSCPEFLLQPRGCFVTLHHRNGQLRGCIGTFEADRALIDNIIEMAGAATADPRFTHDPVTLEELADLVIEVSVLTSREPLGDPLAMRVGVDGIYIVDPAAGPGRAGCFLPQVAPEQGWDVEETLSFCCSHKMGLPADAWREPTRLKFYRFEATVISEGDAP